MEQLRERSRARMEEYLQHHTVLESELEECIWDYYRQTAPSLQEFYSRYTPEWEVFYEHETLPPTDFLIFLQRMETAFRKLQGRTCRLISLKNIHGALEYKEMEAWQKLIRVLTHEIMNSITPIISLADTLNERSQEHPNDARTHTYIQQGLQVIYRRGKGLLEFVENYRKLTRISAPMKTEIPLEQFLSDLQRLYPELEVQYKCPSSQLTWYADRTQMEQVFINLLKNAREACAHRSHPDIRIQVEPHAQELIFEISDNGEGMLPEVTERIFVPFFTTKNNGSGIGLTLCKQIISLHGGQISVQSTAGKGSCFRLSFPAV